MADIPCIFRTRTSYQTKKIVYCWGKHGEFSIQRMPNWKYLGRSGNFSLSNWPHTDHSLRAVAKGSLTCWERGILQTRDNVNSRPRRIENLYILPNQLTPIEEGFYLLAEKPSNQFLISGYSRVDRVYLHIPQTKRTPLQQLLYLQAEKQNVMFLYPGYPRAINKERKS